MRRAALLFAACGMGARAARAPWGGEFPTQRPPSLVTVSTRRSYLIVLISNCARFKLFLAP
eukprot:8883328-Pyramimonas_sp.AAC.1